MTDSALRVLVVGYGPVGARFAEALLPAVRAGRIALTVVGAEQSDAYNRVLVAEYAVGRMERDSLTIADRLAVERAGGHVITGVSVVELDRTAQVAVLSDGQRIPFDRVVLATGSRANVPTLDGVPRGAHRPAGTDDALPDGVTALRDLDDAARIRDAVRSGRRIVVLGAGVLGLEFALAAAHAGADVAVVHHGPHPMPRNLDRGAGSVLRRAVRRTGVTIFAHSRAETVLFHTAEDGRQAFDRVITADGKDIAGDMLVLSCGVSPRAELAEASGLRASFGVVVDRGLRSWTDPSVFAIGDCAHIADAAEPDSSARIAGAPSGLIGPGWRQADWLAARFLAGTETAGGDALPAERDPLVMLKAEHVDVVAAGDVSADPWDDDPDGRQVAQWADPEHGRYTKMVSAGGILTGFVCVGMPRTAAELTLLYERGDELPADRSLLLRFDGPDFDPDAGSASLSPHATVCWCNGVSVQQIDDSIAAGNDTVECVGRDTRAGTGCGGCRTRISDMLARHAVEPA
ncbi:assimilatory nitrate reductase electron transfer subunit [Microbacterium sp. cf046]|uniref:FAD-dependent oxidoreductase n=1 Tax=Microbacterium sp. cf046 TaxID=1761803 RepID=UPI0008F3D85B|nr:FAD-dependent oxidoreductase [Microbacterium sp. cf046]SFS06527.1 assimilatory nitrate reductase electron transfer subunit [Microbacterium sp. cf046]